MALRKVCSTLSPEGIVATVCIAQIIIWTTAPTLLNQAPPLDVVEGYSVGREWVIGTYKHPALPTWLLETSRLLTGAIGWPAYLLSQLFIAATLLIVFILGRETIGALRGAAAVLLQTGIFYFSWPTPEFNHNVAQYPVLAGFVLALWRATDRGCLWRWALLGLIAAAGLYIKLSFGIVLFVAGLWMLADARSRATLLSPGPWLALAVSVVLTAPLFWWLLAYDLAPVRYPANRVKWDSIGVVGFIAAHFGMWAMMAAAGGLRMLYSAKLTNETFDRRWVPFILTMWLGPLVGIYVASLITGTGVRAGWLASLSSLSGLVAITLVARQVTPTVLKRLTVSAAIFLVVVPSAFAIDSTLKLRKSATGSHIYRTQRTNWPQEEIAHELGRRWIAATGAPLQIVVGEMWVAGLVALTAPDQPSVMELDPTRSPWVGEDDVARAGALVVWSEPGGASPTDIMARYRGYEAEYLTFSIPIAPDAQPIRIGYIIVPPRGRP